MSLYYDINLHNRALYHDAFVFVIVILGNILDQNLLEHFAFEKDRERMHEGCVTENPFFAFDKVVYFSYVDLFRIASNTSRHWISKIG